MSQQPAAAPPVARGVPANLNPLQQQQYTLYQQQQQQAEMDAKKLQDMIDALGLINNIRNDMNMILDNVGKSNTANNYSSILAARTNNSSEANLRFQQH